MTMIMMVLTQQGFHKLLLSLIGSLPYTLSGTHTGVENNQDGGRGDGDGDDDESFKDLL